MASKWPDFGASIRCKVYKVAGKQCTSSYQDQESFTEKIPFIWLRIRIPNGIHLKDSTSQKYLGFVTLSDDLILDSTQDLLVDQRKLFIHLYDGVQEHDELVAPSGTVLDGDDDGFKILLQYVQGVLVQGQKELFRISLRATFDLDLDIMGGYLLSVRGIRCGKTVCIGDSERLKAAFRAKIAYRWEKYLSVMEYVENQCLPLLFGRFDNLDWLDYYHQTTALRQLKRSSGDDEAQPDDMNTVATTWPLIGDGDYDEDDNMSINSVETFDTSFSTFTGTANPTTTGTGGKRKRRKFLALPEIPIITLPSNPFIRNLFPNPSVQISVVPGIITTKLVLEILFSRPPGFNFTTGVVEFNSTLNGQVVAHIAVNPFSFDSMCRECRIEVAITPIAAARPVSGSVSTIRSFLRGALAGVASGLLYQDWGASSTLVGIEGFRMHDADGVYIEWVTRLVEGVDDIDVPLFSKILRAILEGRPIEANDLIA